MSRAVIVILVILLFVRGSLSLTDSCNPSPCGNTGTCSSTGFGYTCSCPPSFHGLNCRTGYTYGNTAVHRSYLDAASWAIVLVDPSKVIPVKGILKQWTVYLSRSDTVHLQIWRPDVTTGDFKLIGSSNVSWSGSAGVQTVNASIPVEQFDVMGLHYGVRNPVPFDRSACYSGNKQFHSYFELSEPRVGYSKSFAVLESSSYPCRTYSVQAYIQMEPTFTDAQPVSSLCSPTTSKYILAARTTPGWIRSPLYPLKYEASSTCYWTISTSIPTHIIVLDVKDSRLQSNSQDCDDYVQVYKVSDGSTIKKWCGITIPGKIITYSISVQVMLKTDFMTQYRGFSLSYTSVDKDSVPEEPNNRALIVGLVVLTIGVSIITTIVCCCKKEKSTD